MMKQCTPEAFCSKCGEGLYFNTVTFHWEHYLQGTRCDVGYALPEPPPTHMLTIADDVVEELQLDTA